MKRFLIFITIFLVSTLTANAYFTDIQEDSLDYFYEQGIFTGYEDGTFGPQNPLTRAELIKIVLEADRQELSATDLNCFSDITDEHWSAPYVCTAKDLGYIDGYDDGSYKPDQPVNKVEAIKMIAEVMKWKMNPELLMEEWESFDDVPEEEWFYKYVANGLDWGLISMNLEHLFEPGNNIVREDAAEVLFRTIVSTKVNSRNGVKKLKTLGLEFLSYNFFHVNEYAQTLTRQDFNQIITYEDMDYGFMYEEVEGTMEDTRYMDISSDYYFFMAKFNPDEDIPELVDFYYPEGQSDTREFCQHYIFEEFIDGEIIINHLEAPKVCQEYAVKRIWKFSQNLTLKSVE